MAITPSWYDGKSSSILLGSFGELMDTLHDLNDRLNLAMNRHASIGFILGIMVSHEILERSNVDFEIRELINIEAISMLLAKMVSGDLILQDQLISGIAYDAELEAQYRKIASYCISGGTK